MKEAAEKTVKGNLAAQALDVYLFGSSQIQQSGFQRLPKRSGGWVCGR